MRNALLSGAVMVAVFLSSSFTSAGSGRAEAQVKVQPLCKFTYVDHRGHSVKLSTNVIHASHTTLTFIFESGERLVIKFITLRPGHFVAESARSKDPQIVFYPSHSSNAVPLVGAIIITGTRPTITGNFSHLVSDDEEHHITLVSGTFSL
jgi:hypothetical protein